MTSIPRKLKMRHWYWCFFLLAFLPASCGQPAYPIEQFQPRMRQHPSEADKPFNEGIAYASLGKWPEAITALENAVAMNPQDGEAWFQLGLALNKKSRNSEARDALEKAYAIADDYAASREQMSLVYDLRGDLQREIEVLRAAIALDDPHPAFLRYRLGYLYSRTGEMDSSIVWLKETMKTSMNSSAEYGAMVLLGAIYQQRGDLESARAMYLGQVANPFDAHMEMTYFNLGVIDFQSAAYEQALVWFQKAVTVNPANAKSWYNLATAYLALNQPEKVPPLEEKLRGLDPAMAEELAQTARNYHP